MAFFNLKDYEEVKDRLPRFLKEHNGARVITELLTPVTDLSVVVFRANLYINETLVSTGYSFEKEGGSQVNRTSHLENCETSAVGRALANYGYSGNKRPSREEMLKVEQYNELEEKKKPIREWVSIEPKERFEFLVSKKLNPKIDENILKILEVFESIKTEYEDLKNVQK